MPTYSQSITDRASVRRITPISDGRTALGLVLLVATAGGVSVLFLAALVDRLVKHHGMLLRTQLIAACAAGALIAVALGMWLLWWQHRAENSRSVEEAWAPGAPELPAPQAPRCLEVQVEDGNQTVIASALHLEIDDARLLRFGALCYAADYNLTEGRWGNDRQTFHGMNDFKRFRAALQDLGFVSRSGTHDKASFRLTARGRALVNCLAQEAHTRAHTYAGGWSVEPPPAPGGGVGPAELTEGGSDA